MKIKFLLIMFLSVSILFGCSSSVKQVEKQENDPIELSIGIPKSATAIPILRILETNALGDNVKIDLQTFNEPEKMMAIAVSNDNGLLVVPMHTAANLYNRGLDVRLTNVSVWGGMSLSSTDSDCHSWEYLKGKQLYVVSKGSVPDILTQHFLKEHDLKVGTDVDIVYSTYPDISQLYKMDSIQYAVDGEPFASANKESLETYHTVLNFVEEWKNTEGEEYDLPAFGTVVSQAFLSENTSIINEFNKKYEEAVQWTIEHPEEAGALAEKHLNINGELIEKAIPNYNFMFKAAIDAKNDVDKYCEVLYSFKPESIGGKIPDEAFYYEGE